MAMRKTADVVRQIVLESEAEYLALRRGHLNMSAYAKAIRNTVEEKAMKPVRIGGIVIALSRLRESLKKDPPLLPDILVDDLSAKSGLVEIVYERTTKNTQSVNHLYRDRDITSSEFFAVTYGAGEITIITTKQMEKRVRKAFGNATTKTVIANLAGITIRFNEEYIQTPNTIYAILRPFATKRMNIVELISTYTEVTLIVSQDDLQEAFVTLTKTMER